MPYVQCNFDSNEPEMYINKTEMGQFIWAADGYMVICDIKGV